MYPGIHNFSEIGKLNKVLLHRPGKELEALTPATLERLLFDDVPYLKIAQEEHDNFARVLRENGVEVVYYVDEVAKAIADPARQIQLVNDFLNISKIHAKGLRASMTSYLLNMPPKQMVAELIAGIKRSEVATKEATSLMDLVEDDYPFVSDPMPNLYFTRDPGACVGNGINIHRMHTPARKRESLLLKYMYLYNRDFATEENKQWYDLSDSYSIEGGDVLVLSKDIVAVGLSQRTTVSGAETFARNLLQNSGFKKVLAFDIPETRAFMHLDTVFTMVDYDKFTIHPEIEGPLSVYEMTLDEHGELRFGAIKEELKDILALELKLPAVDLIDLMREEGVPMFSLESCAPLSGFDAIGITLPHELAATNVLEVLDLSGIPLRAVDRAQDDPIVLGGGPCVFNPEPYAPFFDAMLIGEGEESLPEALL